jgi:putative ABC transport system permease protein
VLAGVNMRGGELRAGELQGWGQVMGIQPGLLPYLDLTIQDGTLQLAPGDVIIGANVGREFIDPQEAEESGEWRPVEVDLLATPVDLVLMKWAPGSVEPEEERVRLNVVGRLAPMNGRYDYMILMPMQDVLDYNARLNGEEIDPETFVYDQVTVYATDRNTVEDVSAAIKDLGYQVYGAGSILSEFNSFFRNMRFILGGVGGVALLVAAFGVANTMTMAILERTREIGLMKAIGATDSDVLTVFLVEAGLVGFIGGLAGVGLSLGLQRVINDAVAGISPDQGGVQFLPFDASRIGDQLIIIPPTLMLFAIGLATAVGVLAGVLPALRAANLPPVMALKQE